MGWDADAIIRFSSSLNVTFSRWNLVLTIGSRSTAERNCEECLTMLQPIG
jgi:hypothetical protein